MRPNLAAFLLATILVPTVALAASPAAPAADTTSPRRISTGVTPPAVLNLKEVSVSEDAMRNVFTANPSVVVELTVTENGTAQDARVVKSLNPKADQEVLAAVREFRFRPATLDAQPVPLNLQLTVLLQR